MSAKALFPGLVFDELDRLVTVAQVGSEACYVVDDAGFRRHISAEGVDRQVLAQIIGMIRGNEDELSKQTAKMLGSDDPFSRAMIEKQLKNVDQQVEALFQTGIPEEMRAYLGMTGFKVVIDVHGNVINFDQPGVASDEE